MDKTGLKKYAVGSICAVLLGGAVISNASDTDSEMSITYSSTSITYEAPDAPEKTEVIFEAPAQTTAATTVPSTTVYTTSAATSAATTSTDKTTAPVPAETTTSSTKPQTTSAAPQEAVVEINKTSPNVSVIVYVSNSGKYHKRPDCSGMKHYTEMSLADAKSSNYAACKKCYK